MHLSLGSQLSILSSFARTATTICRLRAFTANIFAPLAPSHTIDITRISAPHPSAGPPTRPTPRTIEAFAEAIFAEFNAFDIWCAERESNIIRAAAGVRSPLVVSLLSLKKSIVDEFGGAFDALLDVVADVFSAAGGGIRRDPAPEPWDAGEWAKLRVSPARITALVLDTLLRAIHDCGLCGEVRAAAALFRVFARAAEPVWEMTRAWLRDGMNMRIGSYLAVGAGSARGSSLDEDFFVEDNELPVLDPDFWEEGFVLRENSSNDQEGGDGGVSKRTVPAFLAHVADLVLGAGKALGLLRALGAGTDLHVGDYHTWISGWRSFADIARPIQEVIERGGAEISSAALSKDVLSVMVYDWLAPHCQTAQARLAKVFVDECDFWYHLQAIENVYLMRRGDAMSHFVDVLFGRVSTIKMLQAFPVMLMSSPRWTPANHGRTSTS